MNTLIQADIFFFVSTIALVVISIGLVVAVLYVIKILRDVSEVSTKVREESDEMIADFKALRTNLKTEGFRLGAIGRFFLGMFKRRSGRSKK